MLWFPFSSAAYIGFLILVNIDTLVITKHDKKKKEREIEKKKKISCVQNGNCDHSGSPGILV